MYAINHAATALVIKQKYPQARMSWLLLGVQLIEVMWVVFQFLGIEHIAVQGDTVHLDYLPYSHSIFTSGVLALAAWLILAKGFKRPKLGAALALAIASHIVLDLTVHEPDIQLAPFIDQPRLGLNLYALPLLAFAWETGYGVWCWWMYKGSKKLLAAILIFNVMDIPFLFPKVMPAGSGALLGQTPTIVAAIILVQILATWFVVWLLSRRQNAALENPLLASRSLPAMAAK